MLKPARRVESVISQKDVNKPKSRNSFRTFIMSVVVGLMTISSLAGCLVKTGTYAPIDVFSEMHYSHSYRSQEPPRLQSPSGVVPIGGVDPELTLAEYASLENPKELNQDDRSVASELFRVNCSMCHGPLGKGDGPVGYKIGQGGYVIPPNLTEPTSIERSDGELFGLITKGVYVMPRFKGLLSADERWLLVGHIRGLQGQ